MKFVNLLFDFKMLERYQELEFVNRLSLKRMKQCQAGIVFSCCFCGEGNSQGRKRRAYILINKDNVMFYCHNCNRALNLKSFLKETNLMLYEEYINLEKEQYIKKLKDGRVRQKREKGKDWNSEHPKVSYEKFPEEYFKPLIENAKALRYIRNRAIPTEKWEEIFYCRTQKSIPDEIEVFQGMVIFPFIAKDKGVYGWQGRSIESKFFSIFVNGNSPKVYNLYNVDNSKRIYAFESIFDSLFVDNSIAILGSDIDQNLIADFKDLVFVFDNDHPGVVKSLKYLELGYQVMYWPESVKSKDVNEMIINKDFSDIPIIDVINDNLISGIHGITKMKLRGVKKK